MSITKDRDTTQYYASIRLSTRPESLPSTQLITATHGTDFDGTAISILPYKVSSSPLALLKYKAVNGSQLSQDTFFDPTKMMSLTIFLMYFFSFATFLGLVVKQ